MKGGLGGMGTQQANSGGGNHGHGMSQQSINSYAQ